MDAKQWTKTLAVTAALALAPATALAQGGSLGNNSDTYTIPQSRPGPRLRDRHGERQRVR